MYTLLSWVKGLWRNGDSREEDSVEDSAFKKVMENPDLVLHMGGENRHLLRTLAKTSMGEAQLGARQQYERLKKQGKNICSEYHLRNCEKSETVGRLIFAKPQMWLEQGLLNSFYEDVELRDWRESFQSAEGDFIEPLQEMCQNGIHYVHWVEGHKTWRYYDLVELNSDEDTFRHMFKCTKKLDHHGSRLKYLCLAIASGSFAQLETLRFETSVFGRPGIGDAGLSEIADAATAGPLRNLKQLDIALNQIGDKGMDSLSSAIKSGSFASLGVLNLSDNRIGHAGIKVLAAAIGSLAALKELYLSGNEFGDAGMTELSHAIASGSLRALEILDLRNTPLYGNQIGDAGMAELSRAIASGSLGALTALALNHNQIGDSGMAEFSRAISSGSLPKLKILYLSNNRIGDAGMIKLSRAIASGSLGALEFLGLSENQITPDGLNSFAEAMESGSLKSLEELFLFGNQIYRNPYYYRFATATSALPRLSTIVLDRFNLQPVVSLDLYDKALDYVDMLIITNVIVNGWPSYWRVEEVNLGRNRIGTAGMAMFSRAIMNKKMDLTHLNLHKNQIGDYGVEMLSGAITSGSLRRLKVLRLSENQIGDGGMQYLADAIAVPNMPLRALKLLNLADNRIGDDGMASFLKCSPNLPNLWSLDLHNNQIGDKWVTSFETLETGSLPNLSSLTLSNNNINQAGMAGLRDAIDRRFLRSLTFLYLFGNPGREEIVKDALESRHG